MTASDKPMQDPEKPGGAVPLVHAELAGGQNASPHPTVVQKSPLQRELKITRSVRPGVKSKGDAIPQAPAAPGSPLLIHPILPAKTPAPATPGNNDGVKKIPIARKNRLSVQPATVRRMLQKPEIEDNNIILHRSPNFFVRTAYHRGQKLNSLRRRTGHTTLLPRIVPQQEKRIADSETRIMPGVAPINPLKLKAIPIPAWLEAVVIGLWLLIGLAAHAYNMFNFPRYELDEGTYMSGAWAVVQGQLWPYAYGYGHPPLGWIQIAAWTQLTGGFFSFGNAINSGRVLMLFYALACSLLVYLILRRLHGSRTTALLAMILFSLSPLSITYQRPVFLDNIGTFWLLLSLYLLITGNSRLHVILLAAISFGIALLSKEIFLFFLPVMFYALWLHTTRFQRKFAFIAFTYTVLALGSSFALMAALKGEFFPAGVLPWDHHQHLSLLDNYFAQLKRSQNEGRFIDSWNAWTQTDHLLIVVSLAATLFNLILGWWNRKLLLLSLLAASFWALLVRGGVVFPFYIIPLLPFIASNIAVATHTLVSGLSKLVHFDLARVLLIFAFIAVVIPYDLQHATILFNQHPTSAATDAAIWIRANVPHTSMLVINSFFYLELREEGGEGVGNGATYPYAHVYWNVAFDPEIHHDLLKDDWQRIDYIVADSAMLYDINAFGGPMNIIAEALHHSILRKEFRADDHEYQVTYKIYQVIHAPPSSIVLHSHASHSTTLPMLI